LAPPSGALGLGVYVNSFWESRPRTSLPRRHDLGPRTGGERRLDAAAAGSTRLPAGFISARARPKCARPAPGPVDSRAKPAAGDDSGSRRTPHASVGLSHERCRGVAHQPVRGRIEPAFKEPRRREQERPRAEEVFHWWACMSRSQGMTGWFGSACGVNERAAAEPPRVGFENLGEAGSPRGERAAVVADGLQKLTETKNVSESGRREHR